MSRSVSQATKLMAMAFVDYHKSEFKKALAQTKAAERGFIYAAREFDNWAVAEGLMNQALEDVPKGNKVLRDGVLQQRHKLKNRLNRYTKMWGGQPSRFVIAATNGLWRVELIESFLVQQPKESSYNIRQAISREQYRSEQVQILLQTQTALSDKEIALCWEQVRTVMEYVLAKGPEADTMLRKMIVGKVSPVDSVRLLNLSRPKRAIM
jgi:hypothetical protein